jgi:hypothetical protein
LFLRCIGPVFSITPRERYIPVDGGDNWVQGESSAVHVVLLPDLSISSVAIVGTVKGVVDGDDKGQDPGDKS